MIVSHRHRFVFVKTRKTAGTSIEIALSRHCGPDDVVTSVTPDDESLRRREGGVGPQNTRIRPPSGSRSSAGDPARFYNHMPAVDIRRALTAECWSAYRTFTVERNPWEKAVSLYFWRTKDLNPRPGFSEFLRAVDVRLLSNWHLYTHRHTLLVQHVLRHESLDDDLTQWWSELGLDGTPDLPSAKSGVRPDVDWRALYSDTDVAVVAQACTQEIEHFDYEFT